MKKSKTTLVLIISLVILLVGMYLGWQIAKPVKTERVVTADIILTTLHARGFLVTETFVFDSPITIENKEGSVWKDILFGQTIEARGSMEVNLGVDLEKVHEEDIEFGLNTVVITLPPAEIFNSRLVGPIDVKNKQGILKRLLDSDDGYNQALQELTKQAEEAAQTEELLEKANENAITEVSRLVGLIAKDKTIEAQIKQVTEEEENQ